jgi:hypothetical protein
MRVDFLHTIARKIYIQADKPAQKVSAALLDGIQKKHTLKVAIRETLRLLFNVTLISRLQPSGWNSNRTTLISKRGEHPSKTENHTLITIGSIICHIQWGTTDRRLREYKSISPRQKGFAYESGCFNIVQALNEVLRAAEVRQDVALVQLGISKAFDTVPHQAFDPTLKQPGIPLEVRSPIINSHKHLTTKCFPVSCPLSCPRSLSSLLATSSGSFT